MAVDMSMVSEGSYTPLSCPQTCLSRGKFAQLTECRAAAHKVFNGTFLSLPLPS